MQQDSHSGGGDVRILFHGPGHIKRDGPAGVLPVDTWVGPGPCPPSALASAPDHSQLPYFQHKECSPGMGLGLQETGLGKQAAQMWGQASKASCNPGRNLQAWSSGAEGAD